MTDPAHPGPGLPEEAPGTEWRSVVLRLLAALLVLGGAYTAVALYFQDRQPAGMSVDGIQIGSMTRDQAEEHLEDELADRLAEPVRVAVRADAGPGRTQTAVRVLRHPLRRGQPLTVHVHQAQPG